MLSNKPETLFTTKITNCLYAADL